MTDLQRVEISGFKGIEHLEYEPSGVNLVTGRNNTGKTSLLEAIALAFDPTYVEEFGEDIDSLIHEGEEFDECRITVETDGETREMEIRQPTVEEMRRFFVIPISLYFIEEMHVSISTESGMETFPLDEKEHSALDNINHITSEIVESVIHEHVRSSSRSELQEESLVFDIDGEKYSYLTLGDVGREVLEECGSRLLNEIEERLVRDEYKSVEINEIGWSRRLHRPFISKSVPEFGFIDEPPTQDDDVNFIKSKNLLSAPDFEPDSGDAIKRDDLGDFIKEAGLADELKAFNLDDLVFQKEDGEKYSVPYDFMGDGFKTMVGLLWELMDDDVVDQIVLLEEPENHMHPGYVRELTHFLVTLAMEESVQLFVTTHDNDFIDAFFDDNVRGEKLEYLQEQFSVVKMEEYGADVKDYQTAREYLEEYRRDLRGI